MWYHKGKPVTEIPDDTLGFVYLITNLNTGKKYIGKKSFLFRKTYQLKGKKKKKLVESDWKTYYGSNDILKEEVKKNGDSNYKREILHFCKTKGEMNYLEIYEQMIRKVLEKPDEYYNQWVSCKINRTHIKNLIDK